MFRRDAHRAILAILEALDTEELERHGAWFGGATRLVLEFDEYRESRDIDFLCSAAPAYGELRARAVRGGPRALFRPDTAREIEFPRELRADQYGIRCAIVSRGVPVKFEIIQEGRLDLAPGIRPRWSPVACLTLVDSCAEKLLANSDRWSDRQFLARDLIDLCVLRARLGAISDEAWAKAETAYRSIVREDLRKALQSFLDDGPFQRRCFEGLLLPEPQEVLRGAAALSGDLVSPVHR